MPTSTGDAAQTRIILDQAIEATIIRMRETERPKVEIPAPLKWAAAIITALMTAGVIGLCVWLVGTLSEVQLAVRELNTQLSTKGAVETRFQELDRRVSQLERGQLADNREHRR